jgi:hypothetical protein
MRLQLRGCAVVGVEQATEERLAADEKLCGF